MGRRDLKGASNSWQPHCLTHLIGTEHLPNFKKSILIIEDIEKLPTELTEC